MDKLMELRGRACALPNPYHWKAMGHIFDAECDLYKWPDFEQRILEDCERSISYWEEAAKEGAPVSDD